MEIREGGGASRHGLLLGSLRGLGALKLIAATIQIYQGYMISHEFVISQSEIQS
jgi:hypothetical protein